jgi:hypothetical protein
MSYAAFFRVSCWTTSGVEVTSVREMYMQARERRDRVRQIRLSRTDRALFEELAVTTGRDMSEALRESMREAHRRTLHHQEPIR